MLSKQQTQKKKKEVHRYPMICTNCENQVGFVIPVVRQLYDIDNMENGVSNEYWCLPCLNNAEDDEESIGVDVSDK